MEQHQVFEFNGQQVEFDLSSANIMVNATEMAKIFGKRVENFTRIDTTEAFISECLKNANSRYLGVQKMEDLIVSKQRSGTWMHRVLALKFAAWLDPEFELWVYITIDKLMFGSTRTDLKEKAAAELRRREIHERLILTNPDYAEMIELQWKASDMGKKINKQMRSQLTIFERENQN
jgi:hypothetical protein